jgi:cobalamin biosynthesis protein CobD/CbiB
MVLVGGAVEAVAAADRGLARRPVARMLLTGVVTWAALGGRSLAEAGRRLAGAVREGDLEAARRLAPTLVGRDPSGLDGPELCRAAVESVAENTADAVVGPLLWGALEVAEEELLHRLAGRGRADDNAQTIRNRLQVFVSSTRPLLDYYDEQGLLFSVAAAGTIDEVSERILHAPRDVPRPAPPARS